MRTTNSIKIHINQLGPVKNADISLSPLMVFSGESGIGKSYVATLVHYVYRCILVEGLDDFFTNATISFEEAIELHRDNLDELPYFMSVSVQDYLTWVAKGAVPYMQQTMANPNMLVDIAFDFGELLSDFTFDVQLASQNEGEPLTGQPYVLALRGLNHKIELAQDKVYRYRPFSQLVARYFRSVFELRTLAKTFFMPPSRGSLVALPETDRMQVMNTATMYKEFLDGFSTIRVLSEIPGSVKSEHGLMGGDVLYHDGELYFQVNNVEIPLAASASSIKELAPFAIMMKKGLMPYYSTLFEEPESHLHPSMQIEVVEIIASFLQKGATFQITTHSDYIMRKINDSMRMYSLHEKMDPNDFKIFCIENKLNVDAIIDPKIVGAYYMYRNSEGTTVVEHQSVENGIPFDTFTKVLDTELAKSAEIFEKVEELSRI